MQNYKDIHASMGGCKNNHLYGYKILKNPLKKLTSQLLEVSKWVDVIFSFSRCDIC